MYVIADDLFPCNIMGLEFKGSDIKEGEQIESYNNKNLLIAFSEKFYAVVFA